MTFKQIQDQVLDFAQELQAIPDFTLAKVKHYINRGYYRFVKDTLCMQSEYTLTFAANTVSYPLEDYFIMVEHVRSNDDTTNKIGYPLKPWEGGYARLPENKVYGVPRFYWIRAPHSRTKGELGLWPIQSSSYTVKVWAYVYPDTELSADGDVPLFKVIWHDALAEYALWQLFTIYSHSNKALAVRAMMHRDSYERLVAECRYEMTAISGDPQPAIDVYRA